MSNAKHFVYVEGKHYSFYVGNARIIKVLDENSQMTPEWVEFYRKDPFNLKKQLEPKELA